MKLDSFSFSSRGGREYNEDSIGEQEFKNSKIFVLADGLGGHLYGELASKAAVNEICAVDFDNEAPAGELISEAINSANEKILAMQAEKSANMKSTVAMLLIKNNEATWANVGDSRVYRFSDGVLADVTEDHSVAYKKYRAGEITRAQMGTDEDQSSLLRVLGGRNAQCEPKSSELKSGDGFLICSDGIWEYVKDNEMLIDYLKSKSAAEWAKLVLLRVMERVKGGNDNLSVITVIAE